MTECLPCLQTWWIHRAPDGRPTVPPLIRQHWEVTQAVYLEMFPTSDTEIPLSETSSASSKRSLTRSSLSHPPPDHLHELQARLAVLTAQIVHVSRLVVNCETACRQFPSRATRDCNLIPRQHRLKSRDWGKQTLLYHHLSSSGYRSLTPGGLCLANCFLSTPS